MNRIAYSHRSQAHSRPAATMTIAMFSLPARSIWLLLLVGTLASELIPLSLAFEGQFSPVVFQYYEAAKLLAFFGLGFLTPIAWWHYKSLGVSALFALLLTSAAELGQAFIPGHRASTLELAVKLVLLFTGFACGLDVRKYQQFTVGPLCIRFSSHYWPAPFTSSQDQTRCTADVHLCPPHQQPIAIGQAFVDPCSLDAAVAHITGHALGGGIPAYVVTPNAQHIVLLAREPRLREIYNKAALVTPDGVSLLLAARALGSKFPERVSGSDLFPALCRSAAGSGLRVFLLGGRPGSAVLAASAMKQRFPSLQVDTYCPPFGFETSEIELDSVRRAVTAFRPDLLFVALGAPKQEYWIYDHGRKLGAAVCIGVGGTFEMVSGIVPRAPSWIQDIGCEWLYRLCREPRRMWRRYLVGNFQFAWILFAQIVARGVDTLPETSRAVSVAEGS